VAASAWKEGLARLNVLDALPALSGGSGTEGLLDEEVSRVCVCGCVQARVFLIYVTDCVQASGFVGLLSRGILLPPCAGKLSPNRRRLVVLSAASGSAAYLTT
jgi:hypothetical protein